MSSQSQATQTHIVILGGGYAGLIAAQRLAQRCESALRNRTLAVTLISANEVFVERIRLHQVATGQPVRRYPLPALLRESGITHRQATITCIDPDRREVHIDQAGQPLVVAYDYLVYALGSGGVAIPKQIATAESLALIYTFAPEQIAALATHLRGLAEQPAHTAEIAIIGGGLTGIESATEIAEAYPQIKVTLVCRERFAETFSLQGQAYLRRTFRELGITVRDCAEVQAIDSAEISTTEGAVRYDACLWACGFAIPKLAREAGVRVTANGQIVVNPLLQSVSHPQIYAAGDAAALEPALRMACATALPMGAHVADNLALRLAVREEKPFQFGYAGQCISLGRKRGLIQLNTPEGDATNRIITGWLGARIKEMICRLTTWSIGTPQQARLYAWPQQMHFG